MPQKFKGRVLLLIIVSILLLTLLVLIFVIRNSKRYGIWINDRELTVSGSYRTVADVLGEMDITTRPEDMVYPPLESTVVPGDSIQVQKASPVTLIIGNSEKQYWTLQPNVATFLSEAGVAIYPGDQVSVDEVPVATNDLQDLELGDIVEIVRSMDVQIIDGETETSYRGEARTVGDALNEANIILLSRDKVEPSVSSWLTPEQTINISRTKPYVIKVDGQLIESYSQSRNIADIISNAGVGLSGRDYTIPPLSNDSEPGGQIEVIRVQVDYEFEDTPIPYGSSLVPSEEVELDQKSFISEGVPGNRRKVVRIRTENGNVVEEAEVGEWVTRAPVNEVIAYGTKIAVKTLDTPDGTQEYWRVVSMRATSYTAASAGKPPDHPGYGITASGVPAGYGVVAIDPSVVPFRSYVYIPGYGVGFAGDTGGGVKGRIIDLGYDEGELQSWRGYVDVYYLTPVPALEDINYLLP